MENKYYRKLFHAVMFDLSQHHILTVVPLYQLAFSTDFSEQTKRIRALHADLDKVRDMHQTELERADNLQGKFDMMGKEVYSTFQEFEVTLQVIILLRSWFARIHLI